MRRAAIACCVALAAAGVTRSTPAQAGRRAVDAIATWIALDASPGRERPATDVISRSMSGWQRDPNGNLIRRAGSGAPRRVIACGLDQSAYVVSEITAEGYLRLHVAGNVRRHPLWDQFHEGQRIRVVTQSGAVPGVIAVRSTHLWRRRTADSAQASIEQLWVDVGARTRDEARNLGIDLLDPVVRDWPGWTYAEFVAGPGAASRAACAAVAAAAQAAPQQGETFYILSAQSAFSYTGLSAALVRLGNVDTLVLVDPAVAVADTSSVATTRHAAPMPFDLPPAARVRATQIIGLRSAFRGTLAESIQEGDAAVMLAEVLEAAGAPGATVRYPSLRPTPSPPPRSSRRDTLARVDALLSLLTDIYGVSGHESQVREAVRAALPSWARDGARVDSAGNLILALGPDRDTSVFVAHLDETGFEVSGISADGQVSLRTRGGFFLSLFEGQPALVHFDRSSPSDTVAPRLRGVFVPRRTATVRQPTELTAWFGMDSSALVARGVAVGQSVTSWKRHARLAGTRFTARSIDDRAGTTALVLAVQRLDRARLRHKVIFVWSTREETGLAGAAAAAAQFGPTVRRVHPVDTFVSSDSPLESSRFAYAPIGAGAVIRALDNSSATPPDETQRVLALARAARIPLQIGTTNGGNDGSMLTRYGAIDIPISWPARYSHSPVELIDLADVHALARLVQALAEQP